MYDVQVLPVSSGSAKQLEPAVNQPKENEKEKDSRSEILVRRAASSMLSSFSVCRRVLGTQGFVFWSLRVLVIDASSCFSLFVCSWILR